MNFHIYGNISCWEWPRVGSLGCPVVGPGVGFDVPCGSLAAQEIPWSYKSTQEHFRSSCVWLQTLNLSYVHGPKFNFELIFLHQFPLGNASKMKGNEASKAFLKNWQFHKEQLFFFFPTKRRFEKMILELLGLSLEPVAQNPWVLGWELAHFSPQFCLWN